MSLPTEPVGSVPRPGYLLEAMQGAAAGRVSAAALEAAYDRAIPGYGREQFISDLVREAVADIRSCLDAGVAEAARFIPPDRLGTTDDCGFSPFADDVSTAREIAFAKIAARVAGTALAGRRLGL